MASKVIHAFYTDDDVLMHAVKKVKEAKHHIEEVYCPFPVHGLDKAMDLVQPSWPLRHSFMAVLV